MRRTLGDKPQARREDSAMVTPSSTAVKSDPDFELEILDIDPDRILRISVGNAASAAHGQTPPPRALFI